MKLAEKLAAMSNEQATKEKIVSNEIINFFSEKFENGEMMEAFEKIIQDQDICSRNKKLYLDFWTYIPESSETYFEILGKRWRPEDDHDYKYKGVNLKNIYKNVLLNFAELARENFEKEGFKVRVFPDDRNKRCETYVVEISW